MKNNQVVLKHYKDNELSSVCLFCYEMHRQSHFYSMCYTEPVLVEPYNNLYNYGAKCRQQCTKSTSIDSKQYIMLTKEWELYVTITSRL